MRTQVGIVGAGPAGLMLSHLLARAGIDSIVVENRSRDYVEARIRAGLLEQGTIDLLDETGLGDRMWREGLMHDGIQLRFDGKSHRIDIKSLTGRGVMIYGQHEIVKDIIDVRLARGGNIMFESSDAAIHDLRSDQPRITCRHNGEDVEITCGIIAGCDGFHGICRPSIPAGVLTVYDHPYPMGWLGILSESPPLHHELVYTNHPRGFALYTMRSNTVSRHYLQCRPDEDINDWPDERIWDEFSGRLEGDADHKLITGPILQKGITEMRSFVCEPMQYGNLFLAGDSAHIVPPTGAKGMNLAIADVRNLSRAAEAYLKRGDRALLDGYSRRCVRRVWRAQHFSWWMTCLMHNFDSHGAFERRAQQSERDYVTSSEAGAGALAENYAGLPWDWDET
ncbi:MAG: 4-hydroxybenzoate 3-monooxygenase [Hyphomicrobiaceae bacterium]